MVVEFLVAVKIDRGRPLGTFGALSTLSFHETKNVFCGEGGALVLNDPALVERGEIVREKGTNRSRFFRGEVDRYTWLDLGPSYLPEELLAAFLLAQLEARSTTQERRRRLWERYQEGLADWAEARGARLPVVPPHCTQPYHNFYLLCRRSTSARRSLRISDAAVSTPPSTTSPCTCRRWAPGSEVDPATVR